MSTEQLRALRDAANESWTAAWVDRAIVALEKMERVWPAPVALTIATERDEAESAWRECDAERVGYLERAEKAEAELDTTQKQRDHWRREFIDLQEGPLREAREAREQAERASNNAESERDRFVDRLKITQVLHREQEERADKAERERDEARAELAALKAQEPQTPLQLAAAACRAVGALSGDSDAAAEAVRDLAMKLKNYADTHIPLAQHEAALAEARREERERCVSRLDGRCSNGCARVLRAMRDGGEG